MPLRFVLDTAPRAPILAAGAAIVAVIVASLALASAPRVHRIRPCRAFEQDWCPTGAALRAIAPSSWELDGASAARLVCGHVWVDEPLWLLIAPPSERNPGDWHRALVTPEGEVRWNLTADDVSWAMLVEGLRGTAHVYLGGGLALDNDTSEEIVEVIGHPGADVSETLAISGVVNGAVVRLGAVALDDRGRGFCAPEVTVLEGDGVTAVFELTRPGCSVPRTLYRWDVRSRAFF